MPFNDNLKQCLQDIVADNLYIGSPEITSRIEWHDIGQGKVVAIEKGSADSSDGPRLAYFRFPAVVKQNRCYLKPCGYWKGPGQFDEPFSKSKSNASLGSSAYSEISNLWKNILDGFSKVKSMPELRSGAFLVSGAKVTKDIVTDGGVDVRHFNWISPNPNDEDQTTAARNQEQVNESYGTAWHTREMPCVNEAATRARNILIEGGLHAFNPFLAYVVTFPEGAPAPPASPASSIASSNRSSPSGDKEDLTLDVEPTLELVEPGAVDRMMRGSLVDIRVSITRQHVHKRNQFMFMADVQEAYILERSPEPATTLGKRAGPSLFKNKRARMD